MKKFLSLLLSCLMLLGLALPCFADTTETAEEGARRILQEEALNLQSGFGIEDVSSLTLESAGSYYSYDAAAKADWTAEDLDTAHGLLPVCENEGGAIFFVYQQDQPLALMFLKEQTDGWKLQFFGGDVTEFSDARDDFIAQTGVKSPAVLYGYIGQYYFFDDRSENGYVMAADARMFYQSKAVLQYQYEDWQQNKDAYFAGDKALQEDTDVLSLDNLTPVEPVKRVSFSIWFVILPVIVLAAAGVVIFLVRRKKGK